MAVEVWSSDEAGHLMLMPDPTPDRPTGQATVPPDGEPPLPGADAPPAAVETPPQPTAAPPDDLAALRRLIEERERERSVKEAQRDAQIDTMTRLLRGEEVPAPTDAPAGPPTRPQAEHFTSQDDYYEALSDWKAEQKLAAFRQEQQTAEQTRAQQQAQQTMEQRVKQAEAAFATDHPDYVEVVTQGLVAKTPQAFRQLIMLHDDAPAVAYAIAKDEALLGRLMQMPPPQLLYALGRLSGQHGGSAPPPVTTEPGPQAGGTPPVAAGGLPPGAVMPGAPAVPERPKPPPPRPLSGTGVAPVGGFSEDMDMQSYRRWRQNGGGR